MINTPAYVDTTPEQTYRREGYAEHIRFSDNDTPVSFGPGAWTARLELFAEAPSLAGSRSAVKVTGHVISADPFEAILKLTADDLAKLRQAQYFRQVWVRSPLGEDIILIDSTLTLR